MNERIETLAKAAGYDMINKAAMRSFGFDVEKFAELIVKECMDAVREQYLPVLEDAVMMKDTHWDGYVQCGVDSYVAIREHFGVK